MKLLYILAAVLIVGMPSIARAQVTNIPLSQFRPCLEIEDMTKERLDCYDAIVKPEPKVVTVRAKVIVECRFLKEEDERVRCFNSFLATQIPAGTSRPRPTAVPRPAPVVVPTITHRLPHVSTAKKYVKRGRGGCGSRGGPGYRTKSGRCASHKR